MGKVSPGPDSHLKLSSGVLWGGGGGSGSGPTLNSGQSSWWAKGRQRPHCSGWRLLGNPAISGMTFIRRKKGKWGFLCDGGGLDLGAGVLLLGLSCDFEDSTALCLWETLTPAFVIFSSLSFLPSPICVLSFST